MSKRLIPALLTATILVALTGTAQADPEKPKKKTPPKPFQMCLWPNPCGPSITKPKAPRKVRLNMDPRGWPGVGAVTTAIRKDGKVVYIKPDGSLALPKSKIPKKKTSPTSTTDGEKFKTVKMKTTTAAQANEMSERTSKIKGGSKADAQKAFGDGSKSKS